MTSHDVMLDHVRALIVLCCESCSSAADVNAVAVLLDAHSRAVESRPRELDQATDA